jgi:hypothetical protein
MQAPRILLLVSLCLSLFACNKKEHGQCAEPNETVTWFWMKDSGPIGTAYKCLHCDSEYQPANASETPCFYTYPDTGWEDPALCKANVCSDDPATNDAVHKSHGVWAHVGPVLDDALPPGESMTSEESILLPAPTIISPASEQIALPPSQSEASQPEALGFD